MNRRGFLQAAGILPFISLDAEGSDFPDSKRYRGIELEFSKWGDFQTNCVCYKVYFRVPDPNHQWSSLFSSPYRVPYALGFRVTYEDIANGVADVDQKLKNLEFAAHRTIDLLKGGPIVEGTLVPMKPEGSSVMYDSSL
jgi:hypothetical protein